MDDQLKKHSLGFWQLAEPPSIQDLGLYYANSYYQNQKSNYRHSYSEFEKEVLLKKINRHLDKALSIAAEAIGSRALDVGCGEGFVLRELRDRGFQVTGIDFSVAGVQRMNPDLARFVEQGEIDQVLRKYVQNRRVFDLIWVDHVLEHVLDPATLLAHLRTLLANSGVMVVSVPNDGTRFQEKLLEKGIIQSRWWIAPPDHISYFTLESLEALARANGFESRSPEGSFPIDWFLAHPGSNYVEDTSAGPGAHFARLFIEHEIENSGERKNLTNRFYEALADLGLGRNLVTFLVKAQSSF